MGNRLYHIAALIILLLPSCSKFKDGCTEKGSAGQVTRQVTEPFYEIQAENRLDVELIHDPSRKGEIVLSGYTNLLDGVSLEMANGRLTLSDKNRCKWLRELDNRVLCQVYFDSLSELYSMDDAVFFSRDTLPFDQLFFSHNSTANQNLILNAGNVTIDHWQAGELHLQGNCSILVATIYETGKLEARDLPSDLVFVFHYGLNSVSVSPRTKLECLIENSGNVYYYQDPVNGKIVTGRGSGKVQRIF